MYKQDVEAMYSIVCGDCNNTMKQKLEAFPEFAPIE